MRVELDLPEEIERRLRQDAAAAGMSAEDFAVQMVMEHLEELKAKDKMTTDAGGDTLPVKQGEPA